MLEHNSTLAILVKKMRQLNTCFLSVVLLVLSGIQTASDLSQPHSVSNMFGSWLCGLSKELKSLTLLGSAATYWSLWLCRNDMVFERKHTCFPLQVIYSIIHWLRTWAVLQKPTSQDLVVAASQQLAQVAKEFFTRAHVWQSSLRIECY